MRCLASPFTWLVALLLVVPDRSPAQELRGTVRDSASREPVAGAVIALLDAQDHTLGRNITDEHGRYRITVPPATARLRFVRIGFRPVSVRVPRSDANADTIDVAMTAIPTLLEPVNVRSTSSCPRRSDEGSALGLLEQARASLLNTVVSREANPAALVRIGFERSMDGTSDRIARQTVRIDSARGATSSFNAVRSATEFVRAGFVSDESGGRVFYGPDADVLLDDAFMEGYCLRLVKPDRRHPTEIGLGFAAPVRARGRVDIEGVLWVDTTSRRLRQLEFSYVGLDRSLDPANAGGWLSFRDLPTGMVLVDRWSLRLPVVRRDSTYNARRGVYTPRDWVDAQESGGEVARIELPNAVAWDAPLGTLQLQALTLTRQPAVATRVWLEGTDYRARADANGAIVINRLLPGPYRLVVIDPQLAQLDITLSTPITFTAERDSTHRAVLVVPTADDYVADRCRRDRIWKVMPPRDRNIVWMLGRVIDADGKPVEGASVAVAERGNRAIADAGPSPGVARSTRSGTNGIFELCPAIFHVGDAVRIRITHRDRPAVEYLRELMDSLTVFPPLRLENRRP